MFDYGKIKFVSANMADLLLIAGILLTAVIIAFALFLKHGDEQAGAAVIEQDGKELMRLSLSKETSVRIPAENGYNIVTVSQRKVCVAEADCPDQICVKQGKISESGESIICLPHKLVIRLTGAPREGLDAVTN